MANNITEKGAKLAALRVQKREQALRENLKRRKMAAIGDDKKGKNEDENCENGKCK
jgi:hypothetical protein